MSNKKGIEVTMWDSMKIIELFEKNHPDYMLLISTDYMYDKTKIKIFRIKDLHKVGIMEFDIHDEVVSTIWIYTELVHLVHIFENLTTTQKGE